MSISVVIPTYNRSAIVSRSVRSALDTFEKVTELEVIVIDDASADNTISHLEALFSNEIAAGLVTLRCNPKNRGVTGSKNEGYLAAKGDWVIFLDSDDCFLSNVGEGIVSALKKYSDRPLLFFRCLDQDGKFVGTRFEKDVILDLDVYLHHSSYGEALIAVHKKVVSQLPFIEELRGYEGLGCCRIIAQYGPGLLVALAARCYNQKNKDRLSVSSGFYRRMSLLAKGHLILFKEFGNRMRLKTKFGYIMKYAAYNLMGKTYGLLKSFDR